RVLQQTPALRERFGGQFARICNTSLEELRAWVNLEIAEVLGARSLNDWARFGKIRTATEGRLVKKNDRQAATRHLPESHNLTKTRLKATIPPPVLSVRSQSAAR